MKKANRIAAFSLVGHLLTGLGYAQNIDPWLADGINKNIQRNRDELLNINNRLNNSNGKPKKTGFNAR